MTQRITVGFLGADHPTLSAAIAALPVTPFAEPVVIEVHASTPAEAIVVPATVLPTAPNPLTIMSLRQDPVASLFPPVQSVTGTLSQYPPPQPRLVKAVMTSLEVASTNTFVDAFRVNGDVRVTADDNVTVNALLVVQGQIVVSRLAATSTSITISNAEVRRSGQKSGILISNVSGVKVYHNTLLQRRQDAVAVAAPSWALEVLDSVVDARNNCFAADGVGRAAVRFVGSPAGSLFDDNFYASFNGASRFSFGSTLSSITETDDYNQWKLFMPSDASSLVGDPEFRDKDSATAPDLDLSNTSPAMASANALPDVEHDARGERRPLDFVTCGAHEHSEVVVTTGVVRFLELLAGISTDPVTKAVLGYSGSTSLFEEFPAQLAGDTTIDALFTPVDIEGIEAPAPPGKEGLLVFRPAFQVTQPIYGELLDTVFDRADEVGLLASDNTVFMVKRMHSIPFDATGMMHTQFQIPLEIVG